MCHYLFNKNEAKNEETMCEELKYTVPASIIVMRVSGAQMQLLRKHFKKEILAVCWSGGFRCVNDGDQLLLLIKMLTVIECHLQII